MEFDWSKYKLSTKMKFDTPLEYILIIPDKEKLLISYKNTIKIYNINSLLLQSNLILDNIEKIENLYLLKNGLISICTKNIIFLIELNEDNTYKIFQKIENIEGQDFKHLIELKNSNLCILSKNKIFIYKFDSMNNIYKNIITLEETFIQYETTKAENESCIELIYPEKNIENKIAVYLSNVVLLSFWDLNKKEKINNTKDNRCNTFDGKNIFCLINNGKYLLCACIDEIIKFYSTEICQLIKELTDYYWHISILKINENIILSGGDFGTITSYEFDFNHDDFNNKEIYLNRDKTKKIEKIVDLEIPKDLKEKEGEEEGEKADYGHGKSINEIKKYEDTIISTSCYEKDNKFFVCFWNKE